MKDPQVAQMQAETQRLREEQASLEQKQEEARATAQAELEQQQAANAQLEQQDFSKENGGSVAYSNKSYATEVAGTLVALMGTQHLLETLSQPIPTANAPQMDLAAQGIQAPSLNGINS